MSQVYSRYAMIMLGVWKTLDAGHIVLTGFTRPQTLNWDYGLNIGALIIRIGLGVYYTIHIIRNPQNPILIIKAPTLSCLYAFVACGVL